VILNSLIPNLEGMIMIMMMMMIMIIGGICKKYKDDPLIQIVRTHHYNTNSTLLQTANKFKKSFQSETKQIERMIAQNIKEKWEEKRMHEQLSCSLDEKLVDKE
jgi:hypothetical protein